MISSIVPTIAPKLYVPADFLKSAHLTPWGGSPSNANSGVPFTVEAVNATFVPLCAYVSRFSGSVIVNFAPAVNVKLLENVAYFPAKMSAHDARTAFVTVTAPLITCPAPVKVETVIPPLL